MAIDPNIALSVKPVSIQNPLQALSQAQTVTSAGIELKNKQQDQSDQQDTRAAFAAGVKVDPTTGQPTFDKDATLQTLAKLNPTAYLRTKATFDQQDATASAAKVAQQKAAADAQKAQLDAAYKHVKTVSSILNGVVDQPTYTSAVQHAQSLGIVQPGELPPQYNPQQVAQLQANALSQQQVLEQHNKEIDQNLATQKESDTVTNNAAERTQAAANADEQKRRDDQTALHERQELGLGYSRLNMEKSKNSFDQNQGIEAMAQQVASGDVKKPTVTRNNPFNQAVLQRAYEINPQLNDSLYTMTQDVRSTKPNSMGANVTRLGTAILHGDKALDNSGNLGFSEGLLTGVATPGTAAYKQDAEFLTGEVGQFVTGGKLTVDEGKKISSDLMSSRQGVRDSAIKQVIDLSGGKLKAQMEQYKNATQADFPTDRVFNDPDIHGALVKHGVLNAPSGGNYSQTATGPGGHKIGTNDGGKTWVDVQTGKPVQ